MSAEITRFGILDMQVCVPSDWTDERILQFANAENPSGTDNGWMIRRTLERQEKGHDHTS